MYHNILYFSDIEVTNGAEYETSGKSDSIQVDYTYNCQGTETSLVECSQMVHDHMQSWCTARVGLKCRVLNISGII